MGAVARRVVPIKNAHMESSMMTCGVVLESKKPVLTAARRPEIAAGENCAAATSGLKFRNRSRNPQR